MGQQVFLLTHFLLAVLLYEPVEIFRQATGQEIGQAQQDVGSAGGRGARSPFHRAVI